jgi:hypothetical protein
MDEMIKNSDNCGEGEQDNNSDGGDYISIKAVPLHHRAAGSPLGRYNEVKTIQYIGCAL